MELGRLSVLYNQTHILRGDQLSAQEKKIALAVAFALVPIAAFFSHKINETFFSYSLIRGTPDWSYSVINCYISRGGLDLAKKIADIVLSPFKKIGGLIFYPFKKIGGLIFYPFKNTGGVLWSTISKLARLSTFWFLIEPIIMVNDGIIDSLEKKSFRYTPFLKRDCEMYIKHLVKTLEYLEQYNRKCPSLSIDTEERKDLLQSLLLAKRQRKFQEGLNTSFYYDLQSAFRFTPLQEYITALKQVTYPNSDEMAGLQKKEIGLLEGMISREGKGGYKDLYKKNWCKKGLEIYAMNFLSLSILGAGGSGRDPNGFMGVLAERASFCGCLTVWPIITDVFNLLMYDIAYFATKFFLSFSSAGAVEA